MPEPWKDWFAKTVQQQAGRVVALLVGIPLLCSGVVAVFVDATAGVSLLTAGTLLTGIGCYRIKRVKAPLVEFEAEEAEQVAAFAAPATPPALGSAPDPPALPRPATADAVTELDENDVEAAARYYTFDRAMKYLMAPTDGPLRDCELRLYSYDADLDLLLPIYEPPNAAAGEGWSPGNGIVGTAYLTQEYWLAVGPECSDATFGLTPEQQERYRDLTAVAATPVLNVRDRCIAVLSGATRDPNHQLHTRDGEAALVALALAAARLLIDLVKWETDD